MLALLFVFLAAAPDTMELTLAEAFALAAKHSPAHIQARAARTRGGTRLARGVLGLAPSVGVTVGYGQSEPGPYLPDSLRLADWRWSGSVTLSQVVFEPAAFAGLAAGIVGAGMERAEAREYEARLLFDVTAGYLELLKSAMLRDAAAAALVRARENLRIAEEKERLGSVSAIDLLRSRVFEAQAEIEMLQADKAVAASQAGFRAAVGLDPGIAVRPVESLPGPAAAVLPPTGELLAEIRRRNPGLETVRRGRTIADINRTAAWSRALPGISAYWTSSWTDSSFPRSIGDWTDRDTRTRGLRADFPLLDIKSWVLNVVDATSESHRARAAARAAELQLYSTATAVIIGYEESRQTWEFARRNLELSERLYELALEQHRLGGITLADFFGAEADLARARATLVTALCDTWIQAARLNYLLGVAERED